MRTVTLAALRRAVKLGNERSPDWQAQCLEVAMLPAVNARWRALNPRMTGLRIEFHPGKRNPGEDREANGAIGERKGWAEYVGYVLRYYEGSDYGWNSVTDDWYSHSAGCCWSGISRETYGATAIEALRQIGNAESDEDVDRLIGFWGAELRKLGIEVGVNVRQWPPAIGPDRVAILAEVSTGR